MPWLTDWNYRKAITITNTESVLTDYQVSIITDTLTPYNAGKMRLDCGDIRITDTDGSTLNYWIESGCNTANTKIWVKIPSVPVGTKIIYVYYGNPSAVSASNGTNVFGFFDHFEGTSFDAKWTQSRDAGSESVSGSIANIIGGTGGAWNVWQAKNVAKTPVPFVFESYEKLSEAGGGSGNFIAVGNLDNTYFGSDLAGFGENCDLVGSWAKLYLTNNDAKETKIIRTSTLTSYTKSKIIVRAGSVDYYENGIYMNSIITNVPDENMSPSLACVNAGQIWIDWIFIRKYTSPEPTFSISTIEETPANITATNVVVSPSIPCVEGTCIVTVDVTWTNTGAGSGDFVPNIKIDNITQTPVYPLQSLTPAESVTKSFTITGLSIGTHTICPDPN